MDLDICCVSVCVTTKEEALANAAPYTFSGSTGPPHFFGEEKYWVLGGSAYSLRLLEKSGHFSHLSGPWSESCGSGARTLALSSACTCTSQATATGALDRQ